jgi:hypothetical protein
MGCTRGIISNGQHEAWAGEAMRSIHFRVSDGMYILIQQGSEDVGASVAHFCREAAIARAVLWEA